MEQKTAQFELRFDLACLVRHSTHLLIIVALLLAKFSKMLFWANIPSLGMAQFGPHRI